MIMYFKGTRNIFRINFSEQKGTLRNITIKGNFEEYFGEQWNLLIGNVTREKSEIFKGTC